jgi:hypothetical protein
LKPRTSWIWLSAILLSACGGMARRDPQPSLDQYMPYAGPPIQRFSYRNSYIGWQIVDVYKIIMLVGNDAYLLTVVPPCPQMRLAMFMSISNATGGIVSRFDRVQLDEHNCLIDEIRQVDYRRMRQDNPQQREALHEPLRKSS